MNPPSPLHPRRAAAASGASLTTGSLLAHRLANGIRLLILPGLKFRRRSITLTCRLRLGTETAAQALVPAVLVRGSSRVPETLHLRARLDDLYGASLTGAASKLGNAHLLHLRLGTVSDRVLPEPVWESALELWADVLRQPLLDQDGFHAGYVEEERRSISSELAGIFNNKTEYAQIRMLEAMFQGDPYSQTAYGTVAQLESTGPKEVARAYVALLAGAPITIATSGDVDPEQTVRQMENLFGDLAMRADDPYRPPAEMATHAVREVEERQAVDQGKLVMGYRLGRHAAQPERLAVRVANALLGRYPHSLLFRHVREEASLAYYAASQVDLFKGLLVVHSGIDPRHRQGAQEIIERQVEAIREGTFSDEELELTRRAMQNELAAQTDRPEAVLGHAYDMDLLGEPYAPEREQAALAEISRQEVQAAFSRVQLDTVYFMSRPLAEGEL